MHGGKGSGAPRGNRNAWKHGVRSAWYRDTARYIRAANPAAVRRLLAGVGLAKPPRPPKSEKRTDNPMQRGIQPFTPPRHGEGDRPKGGGGGVTHSPRLRKPPSTASRFPSPCRGGISATAT